MAVWLILAIGSALAFFCVMVKASEPTHFSYTGAGYCFAVCAVIAYLTL